MSSIEQKLDNFSAKVLKKANLQRRDILEQAEKKEQQTLEKKELEFFEEAYYRIQESVASVNQEHMEQRAQQQNQCRIVILQKRQEIFDSVFAAVSEKLDAFMAGSDYYPWLKANIERTYGQASEGEKLVLISSNDSAYLSKLKEETSYSIELTDTIRGGSIVKNLTRNTIADNSVDALLEEQKQRFIQDSGLTINLL